MVKHWFFFCTNDWYIKHVSQDSALSVLPSQILCSLLLENWADVLLTANPQDYVLTPQPLKQVKDPGRPLHSPSHLSLACSSWRLTSSYLDCSGVLDWFFIFTILLDLHYIGQNLLKPYPQSHPHFLLWTSHSRCWSVAVEIRFIQLQEY